VNILKDATNQQYMAVKVIGFVLLCLGVLPFVVWLGHQAGVLVPHDGHEEGEWKFILMSVTMLALGMTLITEKGAQLVEAFFGWFNRR
jgi:hypothetical protein